ncbi:MAG: enediyne biosynthesis protein UnbU [Synechocystis sp.]|jgi:Na+-translocating ferredoxin:NAD+ oxidoreductase RnfD subunit
MNPILFLPVALPKSPPDRLAGLRRFAIAITFLTILGHTVLGFEAAYAYPLASLATGYSVELLLELVEAKCQNRTPNFWGSRQTFIDFLLPAHITSLAIAMLLYSNATLWPIMLATAVAIGSKAIFRVKVNDKVRHFLNPSNFGISVVLLLFPWVGITAPYQFTENLLGWGDWLLPTAIVVTGTFLNTRFTQRIPMIGAWLGAFVLQATLRSYWFDTPLLPALLPMTGVAFVLFTFYMVTDPGTTPSKPLDQMIFGVSVALIYGILMAFHVVFGLFFALTIVCSIRGLNFYLQEWLTSPSLPKFSSSAIPLVSELQR